jgi:crotonobetainyl-CoA:carnitine CoA-transferase CaiB-like acyl-CoA transferase
MIDLALYEPTFRITSNLLANYNETGEIRERIGNRNPTFAPAGTFETKDGRYVQIAAGGDKVFQRLTNAMGMPELATDPRYATSRERIPRADELEKIVSDWIAARDFRDIEDLLVSKNVPFGGIYTPADIVDDPHYQARDSYITVEDPEDGPMAMPGVIPKLMGTPGRVTSTGPRLGQHNTKIYRDVLEMDATELARLASEGVI